MGPGKILTRFSWKWVNFGFGWVKILLSLSVVDDSRLRLSAIFAALVDTWGRWEMSLAG